MTEVTECLITIKTDKDERTLIVPNHEWVELTPEEVRSKKIKVKVMPNGGRE